MALHREEITNFCFELEGGSIGCRLGMMGDWAKAGRKLRGDSRHQRHLGSGHGITCPELLEE